MGPAIVQVVTVLLILLKHDRFDWDWVWGTPGTQLVTEEALCWLLIST